MKLELFSSKFGEVIQQHNSPHGDVLFVNKNLLQFINDNLAATIETMLKMTRLTIIFEAFYQYTEKTSVLKKQLNELRQERWARHYGTPTITFLLTYATLIKQITAAFSANNFSTIIDHLAIPRSLSLDAENSIIIDSEAPLHVAMPLEHEKDGRFLKTHNPTGGFTTTPCDDVSKKFIEYARTVAQNGGKVLEIGAAFGAATLKALAQGAMVFCNDIDPNNLAVIQNRYLDQSLTQASSDNNKLILIPGECPEELSTLPNNFFDAILICRVMHFFDGEKFEKTLRLLYDALKENSMLFLVCETPFLKNWVRFIPEYENRLKDGVKWPGVINNPAAYESSGRAASLPPLVHWVTKEVLKRTLEECNFKIEYLEYINRHGQFPDDLLLDGKESVGAVASKRRQI